MKLRNWDKNDKYSEAWYENKYTAAEEVLQTLMSITQTITEYKSVWTGSTSLYPLTETFTAKHN